MVLVCVCVCGAVLVMSVITISDWVRAKVCDIWRPSTHSVAVETHLRVTLSSSLLPPLLRRFPGRLSAVVFHMQGVSGWLLQCDHQHPPLLRPLLSPLRSSSTLSPSSLFFLDSSSRSPPLLSPPPLSSVAASDCTGLFGMQEAPEAWRV